MTKFKVDYAFDEESNMFVAVCPKFFGFSIYSKTLDDLKRCVVNVLRVYAEDKTISGKNVEFNQLELTEELSMGL